MKPDEGSLKPEIPIGITKLAFAGTMNHVFRLLTSCCNDYGILGQFIEDIHQIFEDTFISAFSFIKLDSHTYIDYVHFFFIPLLPAVNVV